MRSLVRTILCLSFLAVPVLADAKHLADLGDVALLDLEGREVRLADRGKEGPLVLAYTGVGCPISSKYAARLNAFAKRFGEEGVHFLGVNASPQDSREKIAK